jgi:hypothetical protein
LSKKIGLAIILVDFFTNSSDHPDTTYLICQPCFNGKQTGEHCRLSAKFRVTGFGEISTLGGKYPKLFFSHLHRYDK